VQFACLNTTNSIPIKPVLPVLTQQTVFPLHLCTSFIPKKLHAVIKSTDTDREKAKHSPKKKTHCPAISSTTNPRKTDSGMNPSQSGQWPLMAQPDMKHEFHTGTTIT
jgi:hypothetical protein